jgi:hypothetical protein
MPTAWARAVVHTGRAQKVRRRRCPAKRIALIPAQKRSKTLGTPMANHGEVAYTTADGNDYAVHEATYEGFLKLVKYGTGAVVLILILMAIFLV